MERILLSDQEQLIRVRVASGQSRTPEEVIGEGLRRLGADEREEREAPCTALLADRDERIASADRGERFSGKEVFARLRERYAR